MKPNDPTLYTLALRAAPGNWQTGPVLRLRAALKRLKRDHGLICVACRPVGEPAQESGVVPIKVLGPTPEGQPTARPASPPTPTGTPALEPGSP